MGWRQGLQQRARQGIPALLEVDALLQAHGVLAALPGARIAPGLVRFQLAAITCEGLQRRGLDWLREARHGRGALAGKVTRYRPWKAGAGALSEIGIDGLPADWPEHAAQTGRNMRRCLAAAASTSGTGCCCCPNARSCGWGGRGDSGRPIHAWRGSTGPLVGADLGPHRSSVGRRHPRTAWIYQMPMTDGTGAGRPGWLDSSG